MDIFSVAKIGIRFAHSMPIFSTPKMPMMQALCENGAIITVRKVFSIGVLVVLSYYALWYLFRALAIDWHTAWNIPGFALLAGSMPWSLPVTNNMLEISKLLGHHGRDAIAILSVSLGFATNLTLLAFIICKVAKVIKGRSHHAS